MQFRWALCGLIVVSGCGLQTRECVDMPKKISSLADVQQLFTCDAPCLKKRLQLSRERIEKILETMYAVPANQKSFENTIVPFDTAVEDFSRVAALAQIFSFTSPDAVMRETAHEVMVSAEKLALDLFEQNVQWYAAFIAYYEGNFRTEFLNEEQRFVVEELFKACRRAGLHLPAEQQKELKKLKEELSQVSLAFDKAIGDEATDVLVDRQALAGLSEDFINSLSRSGDKYVLHPDMPTYLQILEHCSVSETRKALFNAYSNRGYPSNVERIRQIVALRDKLAKMLGYASYADFDIEDSMAKTVERVSSFIKDISQRLRAKVAQEMSFLKKELPAGVHMGADGLIKPWDLTYVKSLYKKKHFQIDEAAIAEYFPVDTTFQRLLNVYESFFGVTFEKLPKQSWVWDPAVDVVAVKKDGLLRGYIIFDLYPRPNKFSHACAAGVISPKRLPGGELQPAVVVVIANFPQATAEKPALLQRQEAQTFFHEFGHAMHNIFAARSLAKTSGLNGVKTDFVELPSQMLEEWLWDTEILQKVSSHYKTGEPLPVGLITCMQKNRNFDSGDWTQRQLFFTDISLKSFLSGADKDLEALKQTLWKEDRPFLSYPADAHYEASMGHLTGYGAKYYGYLWSKVFALDLFDMIKKQNGLLNQEVGNRYAKIILARAASQDPNKLLVEFLGREPNSDAFFNSMGF